MSKLSVAIVGLGQIGRQHLSAWAAVESAEVVGVVTSQEFAGTKRYLDVERLLEGAKPDLAVVCTPTDTHVEIVTALLEGGCHVLCEKPLALTTTEADHLFEVAARADRLLVVAHVLRHFESYEIVREKVSSGAIGRVSTARLCRSVPAPSGKGGWFQDATRSGGLALDLMIHDVDFLLRTFGDVEEVYAQERRRDGLSVVIATLRFAHGAIGVIEGSWGGTSGLEYSCELAGSKGNVWFSSVSSASVRVKRLGTGGTELLAPVIDDPFYLQALDCVRAANSFDGEPSRDPFAVSSIAVCRAINESLRIATPVVVERKGRE